MTEGYSIFIETLKQMYFRKELSINNLKNMLSEKVISEKEYLYIIGKTI